MLNIISLTALRKKVTGPGKVVKNLMKGLDKIGYPYVLNHDLNATKRLWIHDDTFVLSKLHTLHTDTKCIIGPNLYALPRTIPENLSLNHFPHIMPSPWVVKFWKHFGYQGVLDSWPVGIDAGVFTPSLLEKTEVVVYFKQRPQEDLDFVLARLNEKDISYKILRYGYYTEGELQENLGRAKYVIWIGGSESQGIAFGEVLSSDIPVLVWDIDTLSQCSLGSETFDESEKMYNGVTSAPYFDESCGTRITQSSEFDAAIDKMESQYSQFHPRTYIETHLSLEGQAKEFIKLYETHFGLSYLDGFSEELHSSKRLRNNFLIKRAFDLYDSPFGSFIRKKLKP